MNNDIKSSYLLGRIILLILRVNVYLKYFMFKGYSVEGGGMGHKYTCGQYILMYGKTHHTIVK